jgi:hypothetical protein
MQKIREAGRAANSDELGRLFQGLDGLEAMVAVVRDTDGIPPRDPELVASLSADCNQSPGTDLLDANVESSKKKALGADDPSATA